MPDTESAPNPDVKDFKVPEPVRHSVPDATMIAAEENLARAFAANNGNAKPGQGIPMADAEAILKWSVENARNYMVRNSSYGNAVLTTPIAQNQQCGVAQSATGLALADIMPEGNVRALNARGLAESAGHAYLLVEMPVQTPNGVQNKTFLVDTTFLQFAEPAPGGKPNAAHFLSSTPDGKVMADSLLKNGFVELNEANAKLYADSFLKAEISKGHIPADTKLPATNMLEYMRTNPNALDVENPSAPPKMKNFDLLPKELAPDAHVRTPRTRATKPDANAVVPPATPADPLANKDPLVSESKMLNRLNALSDGIPVFNKGGVTMDTVLSATHSTTRPLLDETLTRLGVDPKKVQVTVNSEGKYSVTFPPDQARVLAAISQRQGTESIQGFWLSEMIPPGTVPAPESMTMARPGTVAEPAPGSRPNPATDPVTPPANKPAAKPIAPPRPDTIIQIPDPNNPKKVKVLLDLRTQVPVTEAVVDPVSKAPVIDINGQPLRRPVNGPDGKPLMRTVDLLDTDPAAKAKATEIIRDSLFNPNSKYEVITPADIPNLSRNEQVQILEQMGTIIRQERLSQGRNTVSNLRLAQWENTLKQTYDAISNSGDLKGFTESRMKTAQDAITPDMQKRLKQWENGDKAFDSNTQEGKNNRQKLMEELVKAQVDALGLKPKPQVKFAELQTGLRGVYTNGNPPTVTINMTEFNHGSPRGAMHVITHELGHADQMRLIRQLDAGELKAGTPAHEAARIYKANIPGTQGSYVNAGAYNDNVQGGANVSMEDVNRYGVYENQPTENNNDKNAVRLVDEVMGPKSWNENNIKDPRSSARRVYTEIYEQLYYGKDYLVPPELLDNPEALRGTKYEEALKNTQKLMEGITDAEKVKFGETTKVAEIIEIQSMQLLESYSTSKTLDLSTVPDAAAGKPVPRPQAPGTVANNPGVAAQPEPGAPPGTLAEPAPGAPGRTVIRPAPGAPPGTLAEPAPGAPGRTVIRPAPGAPTGTVVQPAPGAPPGTIAAPAPGAPGYPGGPPGGPPGTVVAPAPGAPGGPGGPGNSGTPPGESPSKVAARLELVSQPPWRLRDPVTGKEYYAKTATTSEVDMTVKASKVQLAPDSTLQIARVLTADSADIPPAIRDQVKFNGDRKGFMLVEAVPHGVKLNDLVGGNGRTPKAADWQNKPITAAEYEAFLKDVLEMNKQGAYHHDLMSNTEVVRGPDGKLRIYSYDFEPDTFKELAVREAGHYADYEAMRKQGYKLIEGGTLAPDAAKMLDRNAETGRLPPDLAAAQKAAFEAPKIAPNVDHAIGEGTKLKLATGETVRLIVMDGDGTTPPRLKIIREPLQTPGKNAYASQQIVELSQLEAAPVTIKSGDPKNPQSPLENVTIKLVDGKPVVSKTGSLNGLDVNPVAPPVVDAPAGTAIRPAPGAPPGTVAQPAPGAPVGQGTVARPAPGAPTGTVVQPAPGAPPGTVAQPSPGAPPGTVAQPSPGAPPGTVAQQAPGTPVAEGTVVRPAPGAPAGTLVQPAPGAPPGTVVQGSPGAPPAMGWANQNPGTVTAPGPAPNPNPAPAPNPNNNKPAGQGNNYATNRGTGDYTTYDPAAIDFRLSAAQQAANNPGTSPGTIVQTDVPLSNFEEAALKDTRPLPKDGKPPTAAEMAKLYEALKQVKNGGLTYNDKGTSRTSLDHGTLQTISKMQAAHPDWLTKPLIPGDPASSIGAMYDNIRAVSTATPSLDSRTTAAQDERAVQMRARTAVERQVELLKAYELELRMERLRT